MLCYTGWTVFATLFAPHSSQFQLLRISISQQVFHTPASRQERYMSLPARQNGFYKCEIGWRIETETQAEQVLKFKHGHKQYRIIYL